MTREQEELIIELIANDIEKHSVEALNPTVQARADGRVELARKSLVAFQKLKEDLDYCREIFLSLRDCNSLREALHIAQ